MGLENICDISILVGAVSGFSVGCYFFLRSFNKTLKEAYKKSQIYDYIDFRKGPKERIGINDVEFKNNSSLEEYLEVKSL